MTASTFVRFPKPCWWSYSLALLVAMLVACGNSESAPPDNSTDVHAADEQAVFAAVLAQEYGASSYVIYDQTMACSPDEPECTDALAYVETQIPELAAETVASFYARSATSHALSADMDLGAPYILVSSQEMDAIFSSMAGSSSMRDIQARQEQCYFLGSASTRSETRPWSHGVSSGTGWLATVASFCSRRRQVRGRSRAGS